jgi:predicted DNA-binding transcriptional regulator AlpA
LAVVKNHRGAKMGTKLIDIHQLSEKIGLKPKTIRNRLHEETFPLKPLKQGGRKNFWLESDVDRYIEGLKTQINPPG